MKVRGGVVASGRATRLMVDRPHGSTGWMGRNADVPVGGRPQRYAGSTRGRSTSATGPWSRAESRRVVGFEVILGAYSPLSMASR